MRQQIFPDGYFLNRCLMWGAVTGPETVLSTGFRLTVPDLATLGTSARNDWHRSWQAFLSGLAPDFACQVQFSPSGDYRPELSAFAERTREGTANRWSEFVRDQRHSGLVEQMSRGGLRREQLTIWVGRKAGNALPKFARAEQIDAAAESAGKAIEERVRALTMHLPEGTALEVLGTRGMRDELRKFFAPGLPIEVVEGEHFDEMDTILGNCLSSDVPTKRLRDGEMGVLLDGKPHALLVVTG